MTSYLGERAAILVPKKVRTVNIVNDLATPMPSMINPPIRVEIKAGIEYAINLIS